MPLKPQHVAVGMAAAGLLTLGGITYAFAQSGPTTAPPPTTAAPSGGAPGQGTPPTTDDPNCPNMGNNSGGKPAAFQASHHGRGPHGNYTPPDPSSL